MKALIVLGGDAPGVGLLKACAAEPCRGIEGHAGWPGFYRRSATGLAARRSGRAKALHPGLRGGAAQGHRETCGLAGVLPPWHDRCHGSPVWCSYVSVG